MVLICRPMKAKGLRKRLAVSMRTGRVLIRFGTDGLRFGRGDLKIGG